MSNDAGVRELHEMIRANIDRVERASRWLDRAWIVTWINLALFVASHLNVAGVSTSGNVHVGLMIVAIVAIGVAMLNDHLAASPEQLRELIELARAGGDDE